MEHMLTLLEESPYHSIYICNSCFLPGNGPVHHCSICQFDLHPNCVAMASKETHFLHSEHTLHRHHHRNTNNGAEKHCNGCGLPLVPQSYCYNCSSCDINLHPSCARAAKFVKCNWHSHIFQLFDNPPIKSNGGEEAPLSCLACDAKLNAATYVCTMEGCHVLLHLGCMQLSWYPLLPQHPEHRLKIRNANGKLVCDECNKSISKWAYGCEDCSYYIHVACAKIPRHTPKEFLAPEITQLHETIREIIRSRHRT